MLPPPWETALASTCVVIVAQVFVYGVRFLATDSETKIIAKPQLRGSENTKLSLALGEEIPVPSTTFTPIAQGGANFNPLTSFNYRPIGVNVDITLARRTLDDDKSKFNSTDRRLI